MEFDNNDIIILNITVQQTLFKIWKNLFDLSLISVDFCSCYRIF